LNGVTGKSGGLKFLWQAILCSFKVRRFAGATIRRCDDSPVRRFAGATIRRCDDSIRFFGPTIRKRKNNWSFATFLPRRLAVLKPPGLKQNCVCKLKNDYYAFNFSNKGISY
jgi:hypothetical protein